MIWDYRTWIFDCDGVLLDSNEVKTRAFRAVASRYSDAAASAMVTHHVTNGGVSRYKKWAWFFDCVLRRDPEPGELEGLLAAFADACLRGLRQVDEDPGIHQLLAEIRRSGSEAYVVSGSDQAELRALLGERSLGSLFDGVYGSPEPKVDLIGSIVNRPQRRPAVVVGDSVYDHDAAKANGLDFVFVSHWTELDGWESRFVDGSVTTVDDLTELLQLHERRPSDDRAS
jgi:phosphoglycolate phosphatase-like HAD superfamily hydrolase